MNTTKQLDMRHTTKQPLNNMFSGRPAGFFLTKISVFMCKDYSFFFIMFLRLRIIIVLLLCGECPPLWRVSSNKKVSTFLLLGTPWPNLTETALIACRGERAPFGPAFWGST